MRCYMCKDGKLKVHRGRLVLIVRGEPEIKMESLDATSPKLTSLLWMGKKMLIKFMQSQCVALYCHSLPFVSPLLPIDFHSLEDKMTPDQVNKNLEQSSSSTC